MKKIFLGTALFITFSFPYVLNAQDCQVLVEVISEEYEGDCRRSLAHGDGMAKGNGFIYEGEFKKGYPHGEGILKMEDGSTFKGEWKGGDIYGYGTLVNSDGEKITGYFKGTITGFRYMGEDKSSLAGYKVLETERLDNATYQFVKTNEEPFTIQIQIFENRIRRINNFEIMGITSGSVQRITNNGGRLNAEIVNVNYPVTMNIRYMIPYGTQDANLPRIMRFTINEAGQWMLTITHR